MRSFQRISIFLSAILFSLSYAVTLYVNSTYLGLYFSPGIVSFLYVCGALANIILLLHAPELLKRFGHRRLFLIFIAILFVALAGLAAPVNLLTIGLSFFLYGTVPVMVYYILDLYLESSSSNSRTGRIRGLYLTLINAAIAISPLLVAQVTRSYELRSVYALSFLILIPVLLVSILFKKKLTLPVQVHNLPFEAWRGAMNVRRITVARFVLEFFYALMVIFTPMYLYGVLGFSWQEIGIMFFIMLLPFVIFQWPVGVVADKWWGEKEIMTFGFFTAGISLVLMPFMGKVFIAWACLLFLSRVGASLVEVTTESYFFKHIDARDAGMISIFRLTRPLAVIVGSLVGVVVINLFPFQSIFLVLAAVIFVGMRESVHLKDTL